MYVGKGDLFLPDIPLEHLARKYTSAKTGKEQMRIECAVLRKKGKSIPYIAAILKKPPTTVSDILKRFEERGIEAYSNRKACGRPKFLSQSQLSELKNILCHSPIEQSMPFFFWTTRIAAYMIKKNYNAEFSLKQVYRIMKLFGMTIYITHGKRIKISDNINKQYARKADKELKRLLLQDKRSPYWIWNNNLY